MKSILDPSFRYVDAASTDIRKTFDRARREMRAQEKRKSAPVAKVQPIRRERVA